MPDAIRPTALVVTATDKPQLAAALATHGLACITCTQAAQAFIRLARPEPIAVVIILEGVSGMTVPALAKSLRGLPGRNALPLLLVVEPGDTPPIALALARGIAVEEIARLAALPPGQWRPITDPVAPTVSAPQTAAATADNVILVVDDQEVNRLMLRLQVRSIGLPVETCDHGAAAVARVAAGGVRLVLMDCQMPEMDGYDATLAIRKAEAGTTRHLPIIAVTAHAMAENRQRCREVGMDDFLAKPVTQEQVLTVVKRWLSPAFPAPTGDTAGSGTSDAILDPQPLSNLEECSPGAGRQLSEILLTDLQPAENDLQRLLAAGDFHQLGRSAHKLKGASGSLGAIALYHTCAILEQDARNQQREACIRAMQATIEAIAQLRPVLQAYAETLPKTKTGT